MHDADEFHIYCIIRSTETSCMQLRQLRRWSSRPNAVATNAVLEQPGDLCILYNLYVQFTSVRGAVYCTPNDVGETEVELR